MTVGIILSAVSIVFVILGATYRLGSRLGKIENNQSHLDECMEDVKVQQAEDHAEMLATVGAMQSELSRHLTQQDRNVHPLRSVVERILRTPV